MSTIVKRKPSILDLYVEEIKESLLRGVPVNRIAKDINSKLPEAAQYTASGVYRFIKRNNLG